MSRDDETEKHCPKCRAMKCGCGEKYHVTHTDLVCMNRDCECHK